MSYFKKSSGLGALIDKGEFQTAFVGTGTKVATAASIAFDKVKASWPRCSYRAIDRSTTPPTMVQKPGGYLYKFKDGSSRCYPSWNQALYELVVKGGVPKATSRRHPIETLDPASEEYAQWLGKAQGESTEAHKVQAAFIKAGLSWTPTADARGRAWADFESAPHPEVYPRRLKDCALYVAKSNYDAHRRSAAYWFSVDKKRNYGTGWAPGAKEHRPEECDNPANGVPPELREACKAALRKKDGTSIDSFKKQVSKMSSDELTSLIYGDTVLPRPPRGIPPIVIYGAAAAAVVLVAAVALRKK